MTCSPEVANELLHSVLGKSQSTQGMPHHLYAGLKLWLHQFGSPFTLQEIKLKIAMDAGYDIQPRVDTQGVVKCKPRCHRVRHSDQQKGCILEPCLREHFPALASRYRDAPSSDLEPEAQAVGQRADTVFAELLDRPPGEANPEGS